MSLAIPIEIFELLEDKLGRDDAKRVADSINLGLGAIESRANEIALLKKVEIKEELTKELVTKVEFFGAIKAIEKELENKATKADLKDLEGRLEGKINSLENRLEGKINSLENRLGSKINSLEGNINSLELKLTVKLGAVVAAGIAVVAVLVKLL